MNMFEYMHLLLPLMNLILGPTYCECKKISRI